MAQHVTKYPTLPTATVLRRTIVRHGHVVQQLLTGAPCPETLRDYREEIQALERAVALAEYADTP